MHTWSDGLEDELVRELLDNQSPFFVLPESTTELKTSSPFDEETINRLISTVYSGPTIGDIENALSVTNPNMDQPQQLPQARFGLTFRPFLVFDKLNYEIFDTNIYFLLQNFYVGQKFK